MVTRIFFVVIRKVYNLILIIFGDIFLLVSIIPSEAGILILVIIAVYVLSTT